MRDELAREPSGLGNVGVTPELSTNEAMATARAVAAKVGTRVRLGSTKDGRPLGTVAIFPIVSTDGHLTTARKDEDRMMASTYANFLSRDLLSISTRAIVPIPSATVARSH